MAAAYVLFFANGRNIVANWVKKQHKIDENSSILFKWQTLAKESTIQEQQKVEQTLYCLKVAKIAKIGKMWDKQTAAKSGIKFTLAFSGKYWHKRSDKMRVRKAYGKKWQMRHKQIMAMNGTSFNNKPKFSGTAKFRPS